MSKEFKIGFVVLLGIIMLFSAYVFFHTITFRSQTYEIKAVFKNLEKLDTGAMVRLSGFKIGNVTDIKLTEESYVLVKMRIDKNIKIPKDSFCTATAGAVIGEMFIRITPGDQKEYLGEGDSIKTVARASFDDITKSVSELIQIANSSMKKIDEVLEHKDNIIHTMENVEKITFQVQIVTEKITGIIDNMNIIAANIADVSVHSKNMLLESSENIKGITDNTLSITENLESFMKNDALPQMKDLLTNANLTMTNLNDTIQYAKTLLLNLNDTSDSVKTLINDADAVINKSQNTINKIDTLLDSLTETSDSANTALNNVNNIIGDKENQENLKEIIKNIKETSSEATVLIKKINKVLGENKEEKSFIEGHAVSENIYNKNDKKFRSDFYTELFFGKNGVKLGINDIGERNKGIIQYQRKFDDYNIGKVGVFNSKLGLGYEYRNKNFSAALDWYNPNRSELYLRSKYKFTPNFGIYAGIDDAIQKNNRNFLFGISIEK